jgi:GAF domain-containing protein
MDPQGELKNNFAEDRGNTPAARLEVSNRVSDLVSGDGGAVAQALTQTHGVASGRDPPDVETTIPVVQEQTTSASAQPAAPPDASPVVIALRVTVPDPEAEHRAAVEKPSDDAVCHAMVEKWQEEYGTAITRVFRRCGFGESDLDGLRWRVWEKALGARKRLRPGNLRPFLCKTARNVAVDEYRKRAGEPRGDNSQVDTVTAREPAVGTTPASSTPLTALTAQLGARAWAEGPEERLAPSVKLRELGHKLAQAAVDTTGAYRAAVRLIDPQRATLLVIGVAGNGDAWPEEFLSASLPLDEDTAAGHAIATGESYHVSDTAQEYADAARQVRIHYRPIPPEARSCSAILLRHEGHILGVLSVDWDRPGACDGQNRQVLELLADRYGFVLKAYSIDVHSARLDHLLRHARGDTETNCDQLPQFLRIVAQMVGAHQATILLRRRDTGNYHVAASLNSPGWPADAHYRPGQGVTGWVIQHNRPVRILNLRNKAELRDICPDDPPVWADHLCEGRKRNFTYLAVPIAIGDNVFGVIRVADAKDGFASSDQEIVESGSTAQTSQPARSGFTSYDQKIVESAASRLAGLLDQVEEDRRTDGIKRLGSFISKARSQKELAARVFDVLSDVVGECTCWIRLLDTYPDGTGERQVLARLAGSDPLFDTPRTRALGEGLAGRAAKNRTMLQIDHENLEEAEKDELARQIMAEDPANRELLCHFRSIACLPLWSEGEVVGTLLVCRRNFGGLSPGDLSFLRNVADKVGEGLKTVGENEVARMKGELLGATNDYLVGRVSGEDPERLERVLLRKVCDALRRGLGGSGVGVWVFEPGRRVFSGQIADTLGVPHLPELPQSWVFRHLPDNSPQVVSDPELDPLLREFLEPAGRSCREAIECCQGVLIPIAADGQSVALFVVTIGPVDQINHTRVREVDHMLRGLPINIIWGRLFSQGAPTESDERNSR